MKRTGTLILLFAVFVAPQIFATGASAQSLEHALQLLRSDQPARAILEAQAVLNGGSASEMQKMQAWDILGLAYSDQEDFAHARAAFEQSLGIITSRQGDSAMMSRYADVLSNLADVYSQMGQFEPATQLKLSALKRYRETSDVLGMARCYANLVGIELSQQRLSPARKYMKLADEAFARASGMDYDDQAEFHLMRGWILDKDRKRDLSLKEYQRALQLWTTAHGENFGMSGYAHMLIGKEYAAVGDFSNADVQMQIGLPIMKRAFGQHNARYLSAELVYAHLLDQTGSHVQAKDVRQAAQSELNSLRSAQCAFCTISVEALR